MFLELSISGNTDYIVVLVYSLKLLAIIHYTNAGMGPFTQSRT